MKKFIIPLIFITFASLYFIIILNKKGSNAVNDNLSKFYSVHSNSGCLIADKNMRILMVRSAKTGKYHLPGGTMDNGENAIQTAIRETEEETGIKPIVVKFFKTYSNGFTLFLCTANITNIDANHKFLDEIDKVELVNIHNINDEFLRYPSEYRDILKDKDFISFVTQNG